jgi:hypothetical protein
MTFATDAVIALCHALSASLTADRNLCPMPAVPSNARSATIAKRAGFRQHAPKFVQLNRLCSGDSTICARERPNVCANCENTVMLTHNYTTPVKLLCAALTPSS